MPRHRRSSPPLRPLLPSQHTGKGKERKPAQAPSSHHPSFLNYPGAPQQSSSSTTTTWHHPATKTPVAPTSTTTAAAVASCGRPPAPLSPSPSGTRLPPVVREVSPQARKTKKSTPSCSTSWETRMNSFFVLGLHSPRQQPRPQVGPAVLHPPQKQ